MDYDERAYSVNDDDQVKTGYYAVSEPLTESEPEENKVEKVDHWKQYKSGIENEQRSSRVIQATKSRDAEALKAVLSDYYFSNPTTGEEYTNTVLQESSDVEGYSYLFLGLCQEILDKEKLKEDEKLEYEARKAEREELARKQANKVHGFDEFGDPVVPTENAAGETGATDLIAENGTGTQTPHGEPIPEEEEEEPEPTDYDELKDEYSGVSGCARHFAMFTAAEFGQAAHLKWELLQYKEKKNQLKLWPSNFGVYGGANILSENHKKSITNYKKTLKSQEKEDRYADHNEEPSSPRKNKVEMGALRIEFECLTQQFQNFSDIDNKLGKHLLRVAKYYKQKAEDEEEKYSAQARQWQESPGPDERYEEIKRVLKTHLIDSHTINSVDQDADIPEEIEEEEDLNNSDDENFQVLELPPKGREREVAKEKELQSEIDDAAVMLQMLRIKAALNKRFKRSTQKSQYPDSEKKADLSKAVTECTQFLFDAKDAVLAARKIMHDRAQDEKQNRKQRGPQPSYQASNEQKREIMKAEQEKKKKEAMENQIHTVHYKGKEMPIAKRDPWTDRKDWKPHDLERVEMFTKLLRDQHDLRGYCARLFAAIDELYTELAMAKKDLNDLQKRSMPKRALTLDRNTLSEVRRYMTPPGDMHVVVQAMLLLLGEDEYSTAEWEACKVMLNPTGRSTKPGFNKRLLMFRPETVHNEIARRSFDIIDKVDFEQALHTSPATGAYYVWTKTQLDIMQENSQFIEDSEAAHINRQRELLGKPAIHPSRRPRDPSPRKRGESPRRRDASPRKSDSYGYNSHARYARDVQTNSSPNF